MLPDAPPRLRAAVLASGSGTILDAMLEAGIPIELVILDRVCDASKVAESHSVACDLIERTDFSNGFDREGYTHQVIDALRSHAIDLVVMAGYGTILADSIFDVFRGRVLNTHPALLPAFKGWHAVQDALEAGVKVTGCTVHVAIAEVDAGPILAQEPVRVEDGDSEASLHERIKVVERKLYVQTVKEIMERGFVL